MNQRLRTAGRWLVFASVFFGAACVPRSGVWILRSPDHRRVAQVVQDAGRQSVTVDGQAQPSLQAKAVAGLTFSPDSQHVAYAARVAKGWIVIRDGQPGPVWDGIGELIFSPDSQHVAYAAEQRRSWRVVCDGVSGPPWPALKKGSLRFGPDGGRLVYVAESAGKQVVVDDHAAHGPVDAVSEIRFGPSDRRLAYLARVGKRVFPVVDRRAGPGYEAAVELVLAGDHMGLIARQAGTWHVVFDGRHSPPYQSAAALTLGPDGRHVAYLAQTGLGWQVVADGRLGFPFERITGLQLDSEGRPLYVAQEGTQVRVVHGERLGPEFTQLDPPSLSADRRRWGYVGHSPRQSLVIFDGKLPLAQPWPWAGNLLFSDDGAHYAYLARSPGMMWVVHDGRYHPFGLLIEGSLVLSSDGKHWAVLQGDARKRELFLNIDGTRGPAFSFADILAQGGLRDLRLDGAALHGDRLVRDWVAAELTLHLGSRR